MGVGIYDEQKGGEADEEESCEDDKVDGGGEERGLAAGLLKDADEAGEERGEAHARGDGGGVVDAEEGGEGRGAGRPASTLIPEIRRIDPSL